MRANKTQQTEADVTEYLAAIESPVRRADCEALCALLAKASQQPAKMWGIGIVGFGLHHYRYASGREGDTCVVGFASRKNEIVIYGLDVADAAMLLKLGKHKTGKGCLYLKKLADADLGVLGLMVKAAVAKPTK